MRREVAVTAWVVWNGAGVSVNAAPVAGRGLGLAPWSEGLAPSLARPPARPRPVIASAVVQVVWRLLSARRERFPHHDVSGEVDLRLGTASGSTAVDLEFLASLRERGDGFGSPSIFAYTLSTAPGGEASLALGLRGALSTVSSGEVSGLTALATGAAHVAAGRSEACLCGGMEVSGSDRDGIALFLLEAAHPAVAAPRLMRWSLSFDPEARRDPRTGSSHSSLERLAAAAALGEEAEVGASCPGGHSAVLFLAPARQSFVRPPAG
jgi:hypothetical protein